MKVRLLINDTGLSVVYPVAASKLSEETEQKWLDRVFSKATPEGVEYCDIDSSNLPTKKVFRGAWEFDSLNKNININTQKARDITKNRVRSERKPLLEAQDTLFQRAQETDSDTSEIIAEKNRLRDITKEIDLISDLDILEKFNCTK